MTIETGWLIEKDSRCLGIGKNNVQAWVSFNSGVAMRFARKQDAENMLSSLNTLGEKPSFVGCSIMEHQWM